MAAVAASSSSANTMSTQAALHTGDDELSNVAKSMADCLDEPDPVKALMELSKASEARAQRLSAQLLTELDGLSQNLPDILVDLPNQKTKTRGENDSNPIQIAMACADSIEASLSKIASGGTQASQEIRQLEQQKRETDEHAQDVETAVELRRMSETASEALYGVARLKPGEGLLEGSSGLFNNAVLASANNMIRRGAGAGGSSSAAKTAEEHEATRRRIEYGIAYACATMNDLEVAVAHTEQLENMLQGEVEKGFSSGTHDTEQLVMCVKTLKPVTESLRTAANSAIESLVSALTPRVRSIVSDAVGTDSPNATSFMGTSVMGTVKGASEKAMVRMNYNLDDATYQLLQLSEGFMSRLCTTLDMLVHPLRMHLAPRLADAAFLGILGSAAKRIETALRRCHFTALGALSLDSDVRDLLSYAKDRLDSLELTSNFTLFRACIPLARLVQIARLLQVDDLEDVLDLISSSKRKGNWDLKLEDAKAFLGLRVEFETRKVNELLSISEGDE